MRYARGGACQVIIKPGSQVMIQGKIMQRPSPNIIRRTNGVDDL